MSLFQDLISDESSAAFRDKVMSAAKTEFSAIRRKKTIWNFWQVAIGCAASLAAVSWFFRGLPQSSTAGDILAAQDHEILEDLELLDELELLEEIEKEGIKI